MCSLYTVVPMPYVLALQALPSRIGSCRHHRLASVSACRCIFSCCCSSFMHRLCRKRIVDGRRYDRDSCAAAGMPMVCVCVCKTETGCESLPSFASHFFRILFFFSSSSSCCVLFFVFFFSPSFQSFQVVFSFSFQLSSGSLAIRTITKRGNHEIWCVYLYPLSLFIEDGMWVWVCSLYEWVCRV